MIVSIPLQRALLPTRGSRSAVQGGSRKRSSCSSRCNWRRRDGNGGTCGRERQLACFNQQPKIAAETARKAELFEDDTPDKPCTRLKSVVILRRPRAIYIEALLLLVLQRQFIETWYCCARYALTPASKEPR